MQPILFKITDINHGLQEAKGLIAADEKGLALEFEVKDTLIGVVRSGVKKVRIGYVDLKSIAFKKGFVSAKVILKGRSMAALEDLPGVEVATCTLKLKRKDRKEGEKFVSKVQLELSEYRLREMEH